MCNEYRLEVDLASIASDFDDLKIKISMPEGAPNIPARESIKITDIAPIVRSIKGQRASGELVNRRWSWPGHNGKPVYNFRSEGRGFESNRCLVLVDGFYEFTDPENPKQRRQDKWLFTLRNYRWFCVAGIWRSHPEIGEGFTLLTMDAGEEIAPYHSRQIIPLTRDQWADWLDPTAPAADVLKYLPKGSLPAIRVYPPSGTVPQPTLTLD